MTLTGKSVVVTGASSGICRALSIRLRDAGMHVIGVDINSKELQSIEGITHLVVDLSNDQGRAQVVEAGKGAHALINGAALIRLKKITDFTTQDIRDIYAVNVEAPWYLMSKLSSTMPDGEIGRAHV